MEKKKIIIGMILTLVLISTVLLAVAYREEGMVEGVYYVSLFGEVPQFVINQILSYSFIVEAYNLDGRFYIGIDSTQVTGSQVETIAEKVNIIESYNIQNEARKTLMREGYGMILNDRQGNSYECFVEHVSEIGRDALLCSRIT